MYSLQKVGHLASVCQSKNKNFNGKFRGGKRPFYKKNLQQNVISTNNRYETSNAKAPTLSCYSDQVKYFELNVLRNDELSRKFFIKIVIENQVKSMELNTGATVTTMPVNEFRQLLPKLQWWSTSVKLKTFSHEIIEPVGNVMVTVSYNNITSALTLYIVLTGQPAIVGRN